MDQFSEDQVWAALYLALGPEIAIGEILRRLSPEAMADLNEYRLSEIEVELTAVLDCRDASALGLNAGDLVRGYDFAICALRSRRVGHPIKRSRPSRKTKT